MRLRFLWPPWELASGPGAHARQVVLALSAPLGPRAPLDPLVPRVRHTALAEGKDMANLIEAMYPEYNARQVCAKLRSGDGDLVDMAFSKKRVEDRKTWLRSLEPGAFVDYGVDALAYKDFVPGPISEPNQARITMKCKGCGELKKLLLSHLMSL